MCCVSRISWRKGESHFGLDMTFCQSCLQKEHSFCEKAPKTTRQAEAQLSGGAFAGTALVLYCCRVCEAAEVGAMLSPGSPGELLLKPLGCQRQQGAAGVALTPGVMLSWHHLQWLNWTGDIGISLVSVGQHWFFVIKGQQKERIKFSLFIYVSMGVHRSIIIMGMNG